MGEGMDSIRRLGSQKRRKSKPGIRERKPVKTPDMTAKTGLKPRQKSITEDSPNHWIQRSRHSHPSSKEQNTEKPPWRRKESTEEEGKGNSDTTRGLQGGGIYRGRVVMAFMMGGQ